MGRNLTQGSSFLATAGLKDSIPSGLATPMAIRQISLHSTENSEEPKGRRKKHAGSTRLLILIFIIAIGFNAIHVFQEFLFF
jgi:hypothetical protein